MVEAVLRAAGPYSLRLTAGTAYLAGRAPRRTLGVGTPTPRRTRRRPRLVRARRRRRAVHARPRRRHERVPPAATPDPLIGPAVRRLRGMRTRRKATVTHAVIRGVSGSSSRRRVRSRSSGRSSARAARIRRREPRWPASLPPASPRAGSPRAARRPHAARPDDRPRGSSRRRRRARAARTRAWCRAVDGRRRRTAGPRPLRRGPRRRPRAREAPRLAATTLARAGRDRGAARAVRRVAGARERLPPAGVQARPRARSEHGSRAARARAASRTAA